MEPLEYNWCREESAATFLFTSACAEEVRTHWLLPFTDYFYRRQVASYFQQLDSPKQNRIGGTPVASVSRRGESCAKRRNGPYPKDLPVDIVNGDAVLVSIHFVTPGNACISQEPCPSKGMRFWRAFRSPQSRGDRGAAASPYLPPQHRGLPFQPQFTKGETTRAGVPSPLVSRWYGTYTCAHAQKMGGGTPGRLKFFLGITLCPRSSYQVSPGREEVQTTR